MQLSVEPFNANRHYEEIANWWDSQGWPVIPLVALPEIGIVVSDRNENLAAGWLYQTDSAIAIMEWVVANPEGGKESRSEAIEMLIATLKNEAIRNNYMYIFSFAKNERLLQRYEKQGFVKSDTGMTHVLWRNGQWH